MNVLGKMNRGTVCGVSLAVFGERFRAYPLSCYRLNLDHDLPSVYEGSGSVAEREGFLKSCTAGEEKEVEKKNRDPQRRRLRALCVFGCNALPRFADRSQAISDRLRIIPFTTVFRGTAMQDITLGAKLDAETAGIFLWSLYGYGALLDSGVSVFPETEQSRELKLDSIKSARPEALYCEENLVKGNPDEYLTSKMVYLHYRKYCEEHGYHHFGESRIIPEIVKYFGAEKCRQYVENKQVMCIFGIRWAPGVVGQNSYV